MDKFSKVFLLIKNKTLSCIEFQRVNYFGFSDAWQLIPIPVFTAKCLPLAC